MKKLLIITTAFLFTLSFFNLKQANGQAPEKINYQSVIRNTSNHLVSNQLIGMRISILHSTPDSDAVFVETHSTRTNANGLVTIEIGNGTLVSGNFSTINWADGLYFIKIETDPTTEGGTEYTISGTSQLLSVPYALHAKTAETITGGNNPGNFVMPAVTTNAVIGISSNNATFSGSIGNANSSQILVRGIVYSTSPNPGLYSSKIMIGSGIGMFEATTEINQSGHLLKANTTYYVRAYALTENNISFYGNEVTFTTLPVGQTGPGGGIVFFDKGVNTEGWRYLEAAPLDQSTGTVWGCNNTLIPGTQMAIGKGEMNTELIVGACSETDYAAKLCYELVLGGQSDWFLPSIDELNLMYNNMYINNIGNLTGSYWSSSASETISHEAYVYGIQDGYIGNMWKNQNAYVRAVRAY